MHQSAGLPYCSFPLALRLGDQTCRGGCYPDGASRLSADGAGTPGPTHDTSTSMKPISQRPPQSGHLKIKTLKRPLRKFGSGQAGRHVVLPLSTFKGTLQHGMPRKIQFIGQKKRMVP